MADIKTLKALVGHTVWVYPTGNNVRRGVKAEAEAATLLKVGRVNVTFATTEAPNFEQTFKLDETPIKTPIHLKSGFNSGYYLFFTLQEYLDWKEELEIKNSLVRYFREYTFIRRRLSLEQLRQIKQIIGDIEE